MNDSKLRERATLDVERKITECDDALRVALATYNGKPCDLENLETILREKNRNIADRELEVKLCAALDVERKNMREYAAALRAALATYDGKLFHPEDSDSLERFKLRESEDDNDV